MLQSCRIFFTCIAMIKMLLYICDASCALNMLNNHSLSICYVILIWILDIYQFKNSIWISSIIAEVNGHVKVRIFVEYIRPTVIVFIHMVLIHLQFSKCSDRWIIFERDTIWLTLASIVNIIQQKWNQRTSTTFWSESWQFRQRCRYWWSRKMEIWSFEKMSRQFCTVI